MNSHFFQSIFSKQDLVKLRFMFVCAAVCSPAFYYFMKHVQVGSVDSYPFRMLIVIIGVLGFGVSFMSPSNLQKNMMNFFFQLVRACYIILYLYLIHVNHWTIYQRWSYFVLGAILCGTPFGWKDYLFVATVCVVTPILLGFIAPISTVELVHFHAANLATFGIIGFSVYGHYHFKNEVVTLTDSLIQKSQMAVLGEVAAGVSHEMNSPLMVISNSLDQLNRQLAQEKYDSGKVKVLTDKMYRMLERISNIVNSLKAYSSEKVDGKFEKYNLIDLINESLVISKVKLSKSNVIIKKEVPHSEIMCMVKKSHIVQCFVNLYNNAIEACYDSPAPEIRISTMVQDSYVYVYISDNGPGVSKEFAGKIMQPFFTTKEIGTGTGLGLSVSQGIARLHNGELYLDQSISPSTFVLKLPIATEELDSSEA